MTKPQSDRIDSPQVNCVQAATYLLEENGVKMTPDEAATVDLWCMAGIIPERVVEYLRPTSSWSVCVRVSELLNRALSVHEIAQVISSFERGHSALDIAKTMEHFFDQQPDIEPPDPPRG